MFAIKKSVRTITIFLVSSLCATSVWGMQEEKRLSDENLLEKCEKLLSGKNIVMCWLRKNEQTGSLLDDLLGRINDDSPKVITTNDVSLPANINGAIYKEVCLDIMHTASQEPNTKEQLSGLAIWFAQKVNAGDLFKKLGWLFLWDGKNETGLFPYGGHKDGQSKLILSACESIKGVPDLSTRASMPVRLLLAIYDQKKNSAQKIFTSLEDDTKLKEMDAKKYYTRMCFYQGVYKACIDIATPDDLMQDQTSNPKQTIESAIDKILDICGDDAVLILQELAKGQTGKFTKIYQNCLAEIIKEKKLDGAQCLLNSGWHDAKVVENGQGSSRKTILGIILGSIVGFFTPNFNGVTPAVFGLGTVAGHYSGSTVHGSKKWGWPTICAGTAFVANICRHYVFPALFHSNKPEDKNKFKKVEFNTNNKFWQIF